MMDWDWNFLGIILTVILVMILCVMLGGLHPDRDKKRIRRSIDLDWPKAGE